MKNPKLGFESPEPGEHFKNTSFFEKKFEKKVEKFFFTFFSFYAIFPTVSEG